MLALRQLRSGQIRFFRSKKTAAKNSLHTLKQVRHPAKYALKEPTPATKVLWNDFEKETDIYIKLRVTV